MLFSIVILDAVLSLVLWLMGNPYMDGNRLAGILVADAGMAWFAWAIRG